METAPEKTRLVYLRERKEVIYENLRDLNFEYKAGKFPEQDFDSMRGGWKRKPPACCLRSHNWNERKILHEEITSVPLILLAAAASLHAATTITGTVTNGTSGKPAVGADVVLLKLEGGMSEEARTKTDAQGKFKITAENGGAPHVLRVMHQNVSYNQPLPPGTETKDVTVYEAAKKIDGISSTWTLCGSSRSPARSKRRSQRCSW